MSPPSESFVAALTDEEICPLCLDGYAPVDEAICALCEAPACPGCVEELGESSEAHEQHVTVLQAPAGVAQATTRCFACRPALVPPPALPGAARDARLPPPLPTAARALRPPPLPRRLPEPAWSDQSEPDEGGLVVFPAWRKRPLLALARAANAAHLVEVSSLLVGWAHTGGRRFTLGERVSRVSREWSATLRVRGAGLRVRGAGLARRFLLARDAARVEGARLSLLVLSGLRARGAGLARYGAQLSLPVLSGLRVHGAALSQALKLRALVLVSRTVALSRRVPQAARRAWSRLPAATRLPAVLRTSAARIAPPLRQLSRPALRLSRQQLARCGRYGRSITRACGACLRSARKPFDTLSARVVTRDKHAN